MTKRPDETTREAERGIRPTTRRSFVAGTLGGLTGAALGCGDSEKISSESGAAGTAATTGTASSTGTGGEPGTGGAGAGGAGGGSGGAGGGACTLYPQQTEGPFYVDDDLVRSDITEGKPGTALELVIIVVSSSCAPVEGAAVDVWQCDAGGIYSDYPGQLGGLDTTGQTFLRGTQMTDADGAASFHTIYPGWYPGRTTHIHVKVHLTPTSEVTSQIYFPERVSAAVYATPPYDAHGQKDTSNTSDSVVTSSGGVPPLADVIETADGYKATLTITVGGA